MQKIKFTYRADKERKQIPLLVKIQEVKEYKVKEILNENILLKFFYTRYFSFFQI